MKRANTPLKNEKIKQFQAYLIISTGLEVIEKKTLSTSDIKHHCLVIFQRRIDQLYQMGSTKSTKSQDLLLLESLDISSDELKL